MFDLRFSRTTIIVVLLAIAVLVLLLLSSVQIAGAAARGQDQPQKKKMDEAKKQLDKPLDLKGELQDNDPNDPVHNQPCKTYMVKLKKGKTYVVDMVSKDFDSYLRLEDANGKQVAEDDDSGGELDAQIVYTPEADGSFKIIATRFAEGTGNFILQVRELSYKTGKVLPIDKGELLVNGKLTNDDPQDPLGPKNRFKLYSVKMTAGRTYTIDLVSTDFDAFLRLVDSKFTKLAEDDDGGGDLNSRIIFMPKTDGVYHIIATAFDPDNQTGDFRLTVREEK